MFDLSTRRRRSCQAQVDGVMNRRCLTRSNRVRLDPALSIKGQMPAADAPAKSLHQVTYLPFQLSPDNLEARCVRGICVRSNRRRGLREAGADQVSPHWCKRKSTSADERLRRSYLDAAVLVDRFAILLIVSLSLMMPSRSRLAFSRSAASLGELRRKTGLPRKLLIKRLSSGSFPAR